MAVAVKRFSIGSVSLLVVGLVCIIAGSAAVYTTANGPWGAQDSVAYIVSARSLMMGHGLMVYSPDGAIRPLAQFPPLYPALLSMLGRLGSDLVAAARWLNISLLVLTLLLAGLIFIRHSSAPGLSLPACLLLAAFPTTLRMFSSSMSEPLFLALLLFVVFCLLEYSRSASPRWLALSALSTSLVPLTRYVGIAFLPVMAAGVGILTPGSSTKRLGRAILFGVVTGLPILLWGARAFLGEADRGIQWGFRLDWAYARDQASEFFYVIMPFIARWLPFGGRLLNLQLRYLYGMLVLASVGLVLAVFLANRRVATSNARQTVGSDIALFSLYSLWLVAYLSELALTTFFTTGFTVPAISNRMLLPVYVGAALALMSALGVLQDVWFRGRLRWLRILPWAIAAWGLAYYVPQTIDETVIPLHAGIGTTSYLRRSSETVAAVRDLPSETLVISNDPYAIEVWAERPAIHMIDNLSPSFVGQRAPYGASSSDPAQVAFRERRAALVIFEDELPHQLEEAFGEAGQARAATLFTGLVVGGRYTDGVIYYFP